jgi:hypothetical protein
MASLDDILTTQKNGVVAINNIALNSGYLFNFLRRSVIYSGAAPTGTYGNLYTVASTTQLTVTTINICNTGTTSQTFYISLVPSGGTAGASNAMFYAAPIQPKMTIQWTGDNVVAASGTIQGYASSADVTFLISGGIGGPR